MTTFTINTNYCGNMMTSILGQPIKGLPMATRKLRVWLKLKYLCRNYF
jgi:hypothetical protein